MSQKDWQRLTARLPPDVASYLTEVSAMNATSQNAELIRSVRHRRDTEKNERPTAPTVDRSEATK